MSFFTSLLQRHKISKHDSRPLWKYSITDEEFEGLRSILQYGTLNVIDPRDVSLYYALWWKKNYNGGIPSKNAVFTSLGGNSRFNLNYDEFYKLARKGAQILGIRWIVKQNTLYFKTLLLQGGLPLSHISENQGKYQAFLLAVLEEQPETLEDFIFKTHIIDLLPKSSQNDTIYENCFEIVRSILNDENIYDELLESDEVLSSISNKLKIRKQTLIRKQRQSKPKNYWLISFKGDKCKINLRLGLSNTYTNDALSNILGFEASEKAYQLFVDDNLVCVFRKMSNGQYNTDWYNQEFKEWDLSNNLPYAYVIKNGEKIEVADFIQTVPDLTEPSLWARFNDHEWRLIKGVATSSKKAALLFPIPWRSDLTSKAVSIYDQNLSWMPFEGKIEIQLDEQIKSYLSDVTSFDWTIVSQKPSWMIKTNFPTVQKIPSIYVYDENDNRIDNNRFNVSIRKHNSNDFWDDFSNLRHISTGCYDIRIEKDGIIAYDVFFNIGDLQARYSCQTINSAQIEFKNLNYLSCKLYESTILEIENNNSVYSFKVNTEYSKIPTGIKGSLGHHNKKKLFFELLSPFQGMTITDKEGQIIKENQPLSLANLYGLRILSTPNNETLLKIKNRLKPDVIITKEIKEASQPVISFKDEIVRLFYLADAMDYNNKVCLELSEGKNSISYEISGFSHTLNIEHQFENTVSLFNSNDELDLFAIPLNCAATNIEIIPLLRAEMTYTIPLTKISNQFIIISSKKDGNQLMPRYVHTVESVEIIGKDERIENYHSELLATDFKDDLWKQILEYFNICVQYDLPFSTFDQLRAISRSSKVASRMFLFLGINQSDTNEFIQNSIPEFEKDLGICFHWIQKNDWLSALEEINEIYNNKYFKEIFTLISSYMQDVGLQEILQFINEDPINSKQVMQPDIYQIRSELGERVLKELPFHSPRITHNYELPIADHKQVRLLLQSPIAVAESISNIESSYSIWAGSEKRDIIRRNIQYSQYLKPEFYNRTILHVLKRS